MSMTSLSFRCNQCEFAASSMVGWGSFLYKDGMHEMAIDRALGWCEDCSTIKPIEMLPTPERINCAEQAYQELELKFSVYYKRLANERSFVSKTLRLKPVLPAFLSDMQLELDYLQSSMNDMRKLAVFLTGRKSAARCLSCASHRVSVLPKFDYPEEAEDYEEDKAIYVLDHPHCGGEIKAYQPSIRFMLKMCDHFYDREGLLLE